MRLILGMVLGAGLTIAVAYVHDSRLHGPFQAEQHRLVNWNVANSLARDAYVRIRRQIDEWIGI